MSGGDWEGGGGARRRVPGPVLAGAVLVALAVAALAGRLGSIDEPGPSELVIEEVSPPPRQEPARTLGQVGGSWDAVSPSPLSGRMAASATWTGTDVAVWGGLGESVHDDGALYDPQQQQWRTMAPAPLAPRFAHAAVWTGSELVVAGGVAPPAMDRRGTLTPRLDVAAYDPAGNRWRGLPALPFSTTSGRVFVRNGRLYAVSRAPLPRPVAVLDSGSAMWRMLPAPPGSLGGETAVGAVDDTLLLWPAGPGNAVALDMAAQQWSVVANGQARRSVSACECRLVHGATPSGAADVVGYEPRRGRWWRHDLGQSRPWAAAAADRLVYLIPTRQAPRALDRGTGDLLQLPSPPHALAYQANAVWAGDRLFVWSGSNPMRRGFDTDGLTFTPGGIRDPRQPYRL